MGSLGSIACRLFHNSQAAGARRAGGGYSVLVDLEDRRRVASVLTQKFDEYDQALTRMNPPLKKGGRGDLRMRNRFKSPSIPLFQRGKYRAFSKRICDSNQFYRGVFYGIT